MQHLDIDNKLNLLKQVKAVDAPPFLLTRIRQQIQNQEVAEAPVKWKWAFAVTSVLILVLNISILIRSTNDTTNTTKVEEKPGIENVVNSMNLSTTIDLYHE